MIKVTDEITGATVLERALALPPNYPPGWPLAMRCCILPAATVMELFARQGRVLEIDVPVSELARQLIESESPPVE